jgi:hypothetical protein
MFNRFYSLFILSLIGEKVGILSGFLAFAHIYHPNIG